MEKLFVSWKTVHKLVAKLAADIAADKWEPDLIIAIASGGFIPARIMKTYLKKDIYAVGLRRYTETDSGGQEVLATPRKLQWLEGIDQSLEGRRILVVDEVDDTRVTLAWCLAALAEHRPAEIRAAVLHQKDKPKGARFPSSLVKLYEGTSIPDLWIKYPWDALDIDKHERGEE